YSKIQTDFNDCFAITSAGVGTDCRDNPTEVREYDFGTNVNTLPLIRRQQTTYLHSAADVPDAATYDAAHIWDRVRLTTIIDSGGATKSQTRYSYGAGVITFYGSVAYHDSPTGPRANLVQVETWRDTDGAWLSTTNAYDETGNVVQTTDPGNHSASFEYADRQAGGNDCGAGTSGYAYLTATVDPLSHRSENTYFRCTGELQARRDPNDLAANRPGTTYSYDMLGRVTEIHYPDGGSTDYTYIDQPEPSVDIHQVASPNPDIYAHLYYDGLGRKIRTRIAGPKGDVTVDTEYDGMGRVHTVSNPHRDAQSPTDGVTEYVYDPLERTTDVVKQDQNVVHTDYAGNCATVTDETGRKRKSCTDVLGRVSGVWEDPDAVNYETDYKYNALGDLTCVEQHGTASGTGCASDPLNDATSPWRIRRFTYDSLSRLLSARNPESGTISYTYDADGNVATKTNARGITSNLYYDALHRLTYRSYSDTTPAVQFIYDEPTVWGMTATNPIGRVTSVYTTGAASIYSYDPMGRVVLNDSCATSNCGSAAYPVRAAYDLAGNMISLTYPSGRKIDNTYTGSGRLQNVVFESFNGTQVGYTYAAVTSNAPTGAPLITYFGNNVGEYDGYNNRLQLSGYTLNAPSGLGITQWASVGLNYSDATGHTGYDGTGHNNGNVLNVWDWLNGDRAQGFSYDALNRITYAARGDAAFNQSFAPDAWANLRQSGTITFAPVFDTSNRVSPNTVGSCTNSSGTYCYDAAGNMTWGTQHAYSFDAENRISSVDSTAATYTYDADGNRVRKDVGSEATEYIYFGGQVIADYNPATGDWSDYIYA
ncbi:MAG: hypothetical protein ACRD3Q_02835, partial [Terriglobales bacterium]